MVSHIGSLIRDMVEFVDAPRQVHRVCFDFVHLDRLPEQPFPSKRL